MSDEYTDNKSTFTNQGFLHLAKMFRQWQTDRELDTGKPTCAIVPHCLFNK